MLVRIKDSLLNYELWVMDYDFLRKAYGFVLVVNGDLIRDSAVLFCAFVRFCALFTLRKQFCQLKKVLNAYAIS